MIAMPMMPVWLMTLISIALVSVILVKNKNVLSCVRRAAMVALLFLINIRLLVPVDQTPVQVTANNLDVLFVVDSTISMLAEDYDGTTPRMTAVKEDCNYIIDRLQGAGFCVIAFNNTAQILTPYTRDVGFAAEALDAIRIIDETYSKGSSLNVARQDMLRMLQASSYKETDAASIVFFISDGEITNEDTLQSFMEMRPFINNGAVLGYGTRQGGRMKAQRTYSEEEYYLKDWDARPLQDAVSKIDEGNLKTLARDMGVDYIHMETQADIDAKLKDIEQNVLKSRIYKTKSGYVETYYVFVLPLALLLVYEFLYYRRRLII